jgi:hypothetical protein
VHEKSEISALTEGLQPIAFDIAFEIAFEIALEISAKSKFRKPWRG